MKFKLSAKNSSIGSKNDGEEKQKPIFKNDKTINLCKGKICLADLVYDQKDQVYYFITPLRQISYQDNDIMSQFFKTLDRDNMYVLGALHFK